MSTVLIVVIIVAAVIVLAGLVLGLTRGRRVAAERRRERELSQRRDQAIADHRGAAEERVGRAEEAERRARIAGAVAERERAEARLHQEHARAHELGLADDELMHEDRADGDGATAVTNGDGSDRAVAPQATGRGTDRNVD